MWAVATRFQADSDTELIRVGMGAILDPSNHAGQTAKLIVDATRKKNPYPRRHTLPQASEAAARELVTRLLAQRRG
jgi:3-polyprenyl-4-hydroxybenzoate decarboxylase